MLKASLLSLLDKIDGNVIQHGSTVTDLRVSLITGSAGAPVFLAHEADFRIFDANATALAVGGDVLYYATQAKRGTCQNKIRLMAVKRPAVHDPDQKGIFSEKDRATSVVKTVYALLWTDWHEVPLRRSRRVCNTPEDLFRSDTDSDEESDMGVTGDESSEEELCSLAQIDDARVKRNTPNCEVSRPLNQRCLTILSSLPPRPKKKNKSLVHSSLSTTTETRQCTELLGGCVPYANTSWCGGCHRTLAAAEPLVPSSAFVSPGQAASA